MNKHLMHGLVVGGLFALAITWIAAADWQKAASHCWHR